MKKYSFDNINNIYVIGDCHGEFKTYFHEIKKRLFVKDDDAEKPHPMEIERQARMKAREEASRNASLRNAMRGHVIRRNGGGLRFEMPRDITYATLSDSNTITNVKKASKNRSSQYSNSIFIVAGDCGIGFNKPKYYEDLFAKFNKILEYNNTFIIFVRGNHDDPAYFDGERINLSNIKAVPDYSVIEANKKSILCVGGAISTDRAWRKKQEERINRFASSYKKKLYWEGEAPVFDIDALTEIVKTTKVDYVVSHSAPSFASPETHGIVEDWAEGDTTLIDDMKNERITLDKVFNTLRDNGTKPSYWAYGHFNMCFLEKRSDTLFRALGDGFNPISIEDDITQFEVNEKLNKLKKKEKKSSYKKLQEEDPVAIHAFGHEGLQGLANAAGHDEEPDFGDLADEQEVEEENEVADEQPEIGMEALGEPVNIQINDDVAHFVAQLNEDEARERREANERLMQEINERYMRLRRENQQREQERTVNDAFTNYAPVYIPGGWQINMPTDVTFAAATLTNNNTVATE